MGGFVSAAVDIMMAYAIASKLTDEEGSLGINFRYVLTPTNDDRKSRYYWQLLNEKRSNNCVRDRQK